MFKRGPILCILALAIAGCAKAPEDIPAASVNDAQFRKMSCAQLAEEKRQTDDMYAKAAESQRNVRQRDVLGIMRFGVPISNATGHSQAKYIARTKGEQSAIESAMAAKGCS